MENHLFDKIHHYDEKKIVVMTIKTITLMRNHNNDNKNYHYDEKALMGWKLITTINGYSDETHYYGENLLIW